MKAITTIFLLLWIAATVVAQTTNAPAVPPAPATDAKAVAPITVQTGAVAAATNAGPSLLQRKLMALTNKLGTLPKTSIPSTTAAPATVVSKAPAAPAPVPPPAPATTAPPAPGTAPAAAPAADVAEAIIPSSTQPKAEATPPAEAGPAGTQPLPPPSPTPPAVLPRPPAPPRPQPPISPVLGPGPAPFPP